MKDLHDFVHDLAITPAPADSFNQYGYNHVTNEVRRANLTRYLQQMRSRQPVLMLVAEAPGYRGARLTGVPFSSRYLIQNGVGTLFGTENGYQVPDDIENNAWKEATATIVWDTIHQLSPPPLNWNSYPFHPHQPGKPLTNRKPRKAELDIGQHFLKRLVSLFEIERIIAVGNTAEGTLKAMGISCEKVRHPAQGGKNDFVAGIKRLIKT
ncbi:MAG: uracil-DNA glycosylase [Aggregatilineales bacterium]